METFIKPVGTNDFLPDQMVQRNYVEKIIRETFESYGYSQIQTPLFESFVLLSAQAGEEIRHKMFTFVGPDRVDYALRPELTAPVCRIIANGDLDDYPYPYKLYYIGQCVRQEPNSNNTEVRREFRQAGIELIGSESTLADAEIITLPVRILEKLNITDTKLVIGNTGILRQLLKKCKLEPKDMSEVILDIDHLSRLSIESKQMDLETLRDELNMLRRAQGSNFMSDYRIDADTIQELSESNATQWKNNLSTIAEKTYKARWNRYYNISEEQAEQCLEISKIRGDKDSVLSDWAMTLGAISKDVLRELMALFNFLERNKIADYEVNLGITRGFDFYTGTVFQIQALGMNFPICGGGRYDRLIESFGGPSLPGAGFAFQFDLLIEAFLHAQTEPIKQNENYFIATASPDLLGMAQIYAEILRKSGKTAEIDLMERDIEAQQQYAVQAKFDYMIRFDSIESITQVDLKTNHTETVNLQYLMNSE